MRLFLFAVLICAVSVLVTTPAAAQQHFIAWMDGLQVVSPTASPATGLGCFTLAADSTLDYEVTYNGLMGVETGAHIHGAAPAGINAGVQFALPLGPLKIGSVGPLTPAQVADLTAGLYYVQIHSNLFPGGEIRGQILPSPVPCSVPTEESTWGAIKSLYDEL